MVRAAVTFSYTDSAVVKVQHIWNSFLWEHYAQNAKVGARPRIIVRLYPVLTVYSFFPREPCCLFCCFFLFFRFFYLLSTEIRTFSVTVFLLQYVSLLLFRGAVQYHGRVYNTRVFSARRPCVSTLFMEIQHI